MILYILGVGAICFAVGWIVRDQVWKRAAFNKRIMVVDGEMYQVKQYTPPAEEE